MEAHTKGSVLHGRLSSCPRSWIQKLETHLKWRNRVSVKARVNGKQCQNKKVVGKTKSAIKTKLNFYFVPDRTGQAACRVSSSPSPFWKRLYLSEHSSSFGFHYKKSWTNYLSKTLKFLNDYDIADTRKQPCPS